MNHGKLTTQQLRIITAMRDQRLDVHLGIITPEQYVANTEAAALMAPLPAEVCEFATRCREAANA